MKRTYVAGLAAAVALSTVVAPHSTAAPPPTTAPPGLSTEVTLITGDKVAVRGGKIDTKPGSGRDKVGIRTFTDVRGDVYAVPLDAERRIASGELDRRLFNVSLLARWGYDDSRRDTLPLIVEDSAKRSGTTTQKARKNGEFWTQVRAQGAGKVWLDGKVKATLDRSAAQIGAPQAWQRGLTGAGVTVAVLDTGVDATHPDLAGAVVEEKNFSESPTTDDRHGHGTHVAATITGAGKYQGIAPDAKIINAKVLGDDGSGSESGIIAAMEWAADKAKIVNMSLGSGEPSAGDDVMSVALNRISTQTGALFVVAAGNDGSSIGSPAAADAALTVGAVERDDTLARFSSRGPRKTDSAIKPDITAPGVGIVAAKARNGVIGEPVGDQHVALSGTSMAAPHTAGAAAILAAQHPQWQAPDLKAALMNTAKPNAANTAYEQGAGRVDVAKAVTATVSAAPGSVSFGAPEYPHGDDEPVTKTVTYRNAGTSPVVLDLRIDGEGPFTVTPAQLTVPAGGTADAAVTSDTRANIPDKRYTAALLASNGLRVPLAVDKQVEQYDVTLKFLDLAGNPIGGILGYYYRLVDIDRPVQYDVWDRDGFDPSGTVVRRVPKGNYVLQAAVSAGNQEIGPVTAMLAEPRLAVTGPTEVVVDARQGATPDITVEGQAATDVRVEVGDSAKTSWGTLTQDIVQDSFGNFRIIPSRTSDAGYKWYAQSVKGRKNAQGTFEGSPWIYHVRITEKGRQPQNVRRTVRDRDLAQVDTVVHSRVPGSTADKDGAATGPLPLRLKEFYSPDEPWDDENLYEYGPDGKFLNGQHVQEPRTYRRGHNGTVHWNTGVFGPTLPYAPVFPHDVAANGSARRVGNYMDFLVSMFSGSGDASNWPAGGTPQRTVLSRGSEVIAESPTAGSLFNAKGSAAKDTYRLHVENGRDVTDWTFTSEQTEEPKPVPLLVVRLSPQLDDHNKARAGAPLTFPITVQRNGTLKDVTDVTTPEIQVSYDEGTTWQPTKTIKVGGRWLTTVWHPKDAKTVSFKAKTSDSTGAVEHTFMRAYELK